MAENFDLIFGQSASSQYAWNDSDYQNGWGTVGSTPPTAEQFDALQRRSDKKAQELNNALTPLVNQNTASNRQPLTTYALKDIRYSPLLPVGWYLECSTAGTTSSGDITLPTPLVENATVTDGTCVWKVRKISSANELAGKADRSLSNLTSEGIAKIVGSVVKGTNGYQQLGNGLIVQWGRSQIPAAHAAFCSFPIEFSNTNFICIGIGVVSSSDNTVTHTVNEIGDLRTTGRAVFRLSSEDGPQVEYVAIGY